MDMQRQKESDNRPGLRELFFAFLRLGLTAFGGPTMVAYISELSVKRHKWLDQETFKNGVALCQSIPGATAMQIAAYVGLKTRGIGGAFATYAGFGLPAFFLMLLLSWIYVRVGNVPWIVSLFIGLQVIVVAVVANAACIFGKGTLKDYRDMLIAAASACAFWLGISPFYVILNTALIGMLFFRGVHLPGPSDVPRSNARTLGSLIPLLLVIIAGISLLYFTREKLFTLALLMLKINLFAFGGGFAALPLMLHEVVNIRGWMAEKVFMDGIALGQITPGPIVITATFVGFVTCGFFGALVATCAMFIPSFMLLIIGAHFSDRLLHSTWFVGSQRGIFASFVGLLLFVTIKFAVAVEWNIIKALMASAVIASLLKKVDILYVVLAGGALSVLLF